MEINFVRKDKETLKKEHIDSLKKAIELGHATWGSIEALKHCTVVTVSIESGENLEEVRNIFFNSFYTDINEFEINE